MRFSDLCRRWGAVFYTGAVGHPASGPCAAVGAYRVSALPFGKPVLPLGFFGTVLPPLGAVPLDFAADGAFVAVKLFGGFGDGAVAGQVLDRVSFVLGRLRAAHGNLSCRKGRMLPHTGLSCYGKLHFKCESTAV